MRECVWLGDLTAGKSVIELLILSNLTTRLVFLFHFMLLYIFFRLSCGRVQYVTPEGAQITVHYKHSWQSRAHKHRCTLKQTCTSYLPYTHRGCDGRPVCQAIRQCRQQRELPCGLESFPDSRTAGLDSSTSCPRLILSTPPPASPPASPTASHRAGQQPSEEPGRMRGDGQAVSSVNSRPLRPASWTDSSL